MSKAFNTNEDFPVDIVIPWVDGSDPEWLREKDRYLPESRRSYKASTSKSRFRDWDNLQYIFRGIEKNMPWFNKVFFITWGHVPTWLNTEHEKLRIVKHEEYIPHEYLPTFNTNTIELNYNRIDELCEHFISFNDDFFVIGPTEKSDFFVNGVPRSEGIITPFPIRPHGISCMEARNLDVINSHFTKADIKNNLTKWINPVYGTDVLRTLFFLRFSWIIGVKETHTQLSLLKSTYDKLWACEYDKMNETCLNRFRGVADLTIWLFRQWQMMEGNFEPRSPKFCRAAMMPRDYDILFKILDDPGNCRLLCINDINCSENDNFDFEAARNAVNQALDKLLPDPSSFEKRG